MNNVTLGNDRFTYYETIGGGQGACPDADGPSAVHVTMSNTLNTPVEALELAYPLRVERYALRLGIGGAGRHRGGDGVVRELRALEPCRLSVLSERRARAPRGVARRRGRRAGPQPAERRAAPREGVARLVPGDVVTIETPGGGGHEARRSASGWGRGDQPMRDAVTVACRARSSRSSSIARRRSRGSPEASARDGVGQRAGARLVFPEAFDPRVSLEPLGPVPGGRRHQGNARVGAASPARSLASASASGCRTASGRDAPPREHRDLLEAGRDHELERRDGLQRAPPLRPGRRARPPPPKLVPTNHERLVWGLGTGDGLSAVDTGLGRVGGLICWENLMPLARFALYESGVEVYLAPTADDSEDWLDSIRHIAREARAFVVSPCVFQRASSYPDDVQIAEGPDLLGRGGSAIMGPDGSRSSRSTWSASRSATSGPTMTATTEGQGIRRSLRALAGGAG